MKGGRNQEKEIGETRKGVYEKRILGKIKNK